jgi:hypothetical protein
MVTLGESSVQYKVVKTFGEFIDLEEHIMFIINEYDKGFV